MREAGKKKKLKLNSLTSGIRLKSKKSDKMKLRYKISIWVALALAGSLLCGGSIWLWLAGRDMCRKIPHSVTPYHCFGYRSVHSDLCPHHRSNTLVTHFLNRQIYEKKKQDNRTAMQIL